MLCFHCRKIISEEKWKVKFIDGVGEISFKECCSKECCNGVINTYTSIHKARYEETNNQSFQRIK